MSTIVYLHGFRSSPQSIKASQFGGVVAGLPKALRPRLYVPNLQHQPAAAVAGVAAWVEREAVDCAGEKLCFVGSSLGGYYATHLAERFGARAVLINPALRPFDDLRPYAGTQTNLYTGESFDVTAAHFAELAAMRVARITRPGRYFLLVQTGNEVLDWRHAVAFYGGAFQYVEGGGDHAFEGFAAQIPAILRFARVRISASDFTER
ncbi:MAG: alpha/beta fold hydrolase [Aromatoleum sp.]|nr:alpha/beta fold hydrolase [Aromatoleum sp.]